MRGNPSYDQMQLVKKGISTGALSALNQLEQAILLLRAPVNYDEEPMSRQDAADKLGLTVHAFRKREDRAFTKLEGAVAMMEHLNLFLRRMTPRTFSDIDLDSRVDVSDFYGTEQTS